MTIEYGFPYDDQWTQRIVEDDDGRLHAVCRCGALTRAADEEWCLRCILDGGNL